APVEPPPPEPVEPVENPAPVEREAVSRVILDEEPAFRFNPQPVYPRASKRRNEEGVVRLRVQTDPNGRVIQVEIARGSGHNLLDRAAVAAVSRWHCDPTYVNGRRVAVEFFTNIDFDLTNP
ncbi:MAG: energy transducer TonB, partial [Verrucomicrobia bacterium]|nr:energy transducer TonB [Verrucomicrobiota bacterium]